MASQRPFVVKRRVTVFNTDSVAELTVRWTDGGCPDVDRVSLLILISRCHVQVVRWLVSSVSCSWEAVVVMPVVVRWWVASRRCRSASRRRGRRVSGIVAAIIAIVCKVAAVVTAIAGVVLHWGRHGLGSQCVVGLKKETEHELLSANAICDRHLSQFKRPVASDTEQGNNRALQLMVHKLEYSKGFFSLKKYIEDPIFLRIYCPSHR